MASNLYTDQYDTDETMSHLHGRAKPEITSLKIMLHTSHLIDDTDMMMIHTMINKIETRVQGFVCDHIRTYY